MSSVLGQPAHAPVTDWSYQAPAAEIRGGAASFVRPSFHTLSDDFFAAEAKRTWQIDAVIFGVFLAVTAWPIALAAQAAVALMK
ncbi:MAG: hypothetical protein M3Y86_12035 [Verrucomicrobiota bacterium]|nr:hypothetical protein [Verrucomicrobiota bacterium]